MFSLNDLDFSSIGTWPKNRQISFLIFVVTIIFTIGYFFDLKSKISEFDSCQETLVKNKSVYIKKVKESKGYEKLNMQKKMLEQKVSELLYKLPESSRVPDLLKLLSQEASLCNLKYKLIETKNINDKDFYYEMPIKLELNGGYHDFGKFIEALSKLNRIVTINDFSIENCEMGLSMKLEIKAYWY